MKSKIILFIILTIQIVFSQTINQDEKTIIVNSLDSSSYSIRLDAIIKILKNGIFEALPKLEENIFNQEQDIAVLFLEGIATFDSSSTSFYAHKLIDTLTFLPRDEISTGSTNSHKVFATLLLFGRGDYSTASVVFDYIEEIRPRVAPTTLFLLERILENVPDFENQAKDELKRILHFINDDYSKSIAMQVLSDKYGAEMIPDFVELFQDSISYPTKIIAIEELEKYNHPNLLTLLKDNFLNDTTIAKRLLNKILLEYNTPSNYKFILDNYKNSLRAEEIQFYSNLFNSNNALPLCNFEYITDYQDYIINLCDTLIGYTWLGDLTFSNELKNILITAKTNLQNGDSLACRVQVKTFQDLVDNVYKDSLNTDPRFVTIEGWKFLYWNAQYILDRLPEPQANPTLIVN